MHTSVSDGRNHWLSALVWTYGAIVIANFLLIAPYELADLEPRRIAPWMVITTELILFATVLFAIRAVKDRDGAKRSFPGFTLVNVCPLCRSTLSEGTERYSNPQDALITGH
jgi:hypothetical protein